MGICPDDSVCLDWQLCILPWEPWQVSVSCGCCWSLHSGWYFVPQCDSPWLFLSSHMHWVPVESLVRAAQKWLHKHELLSLEQTGNVPQIATGCYRHRSGETDQLSKFLILDCMLLYLKTVHCICVVWWKLELPVQSLYDLTSCTVALLGSWVTHIWCSTSGCCCLQNWWCQWRRFHFNGSTDYGHCFP